MKSRTGLLYALALPMLLLTLLTGPGCRDAAPGNTDGHAEHTAATKPAETQLWQCPMHPHITSHKPGSCPICGMALVPVEPSHNASFGDGVTAAGGRAAVVIDSARRQAIGLRTVAVTTATLTLTWRVPGDVRTPTARLHHVHARSPGWVEGVDIATPGTYVRRGQSLVEIYAPVWVATQEELLAAVRAGQVGLAEASRDRLRRWGVADRDIANVERSGQARRRLPLRSPVDGIVREVMAAEGMQIDSMGELFIIADLGELWIDAWLPPEVLLTAAAPATALVVDAVGGRTVAALLAVDGQVDRTTRRQIARYVLRGEDAALRDGDWVEVHMQTTLGHGLVVPSDTLVHAGDKAWVWRDEGDGRLAPIMVAVRAEGDGRALVEGPLTAGERIVRGAVFLVDGEGALRAAVERFGEVDNHGH